MRRRLRWAAVIACAALLLIYKLGAKDIWVDEAASWEMATRSVPAIVAGTALDIHPPLYYVVLKGWMALWGDSLVAMRSLSVAIGLAALWLMFELGAALGVSDSALCAGVAWCAVSPHTVFYDQEARMYPLLTALVLAMCLAYRRWIESRGTSRAWLAAYTISGVAALYVHDFASLIIVALIGHFLIWVGRQRADRRVWSSWIGAHAAILLAYAVWLPIAIRQVVQAQTPRASVGVANLPMQLSLYVRELLFGHLRLPGLWSVTSLVLFGLLTAGLFATIARAWRDEDERASFLALTTLAPSAIAIAVLPWTGHLELPRYLAYTLPLVILAAAYGFATWRVSNRVVIAALLVCGVIPLPYLKGYYAASATDYDARPLVSYLSGTIEPAAALDPVYVAPGYVAELLRYRTRDAIDYVRIHKPATFDEIVAAAAARAQPAWLVVDYRSPALDAIGADARFVRVRVPSSSSDRIRLYRWLGGP